MSLEATSSENTDLQSQLYEVETEVSSKVAELNEKIEVLITEVEHSRHERDILSERLNKIQSNTIHKRKDKNSFIVYASAVLNFSL